MGSVSKILITMYLTENIEYQIPISNPFSVLGDRAQMNSSAVMNTSKYEIPLRHSGRKDK